MGSRLQLQTKLEELIGGGRKVYYQPPANVAMTYPCIVYANDYVDVVYADNSPYRQTKRYQVTVIDRTPDSAIADNVSGLPLTRFARRFTADNLYHIVYNTYF